MTDKSPADRIAQEAMRRYYDTSDYFDRSPDQFTDLQGPFQRYRVAKVFGLYRPQATERVLDLGCGWGTFSFSAAPLCREVIGIDYSRKAIALCQELQRRRGHLNVSFRCADAQETGEPSAAFDVVLCADLVEHLTPEVFEKALDEAHRVLRPGGKLAVWTPHRGHLFEILKAHHLLLKRDPTHVDFKSMSRLLRALESRRFLIRKARYDESHLPGFRHVERALGPFLPLFRRRIAILAEKALG